ncbi:hypothetical protein NE237_029883 [Protea cynaroides]|uniref:Uncharacterized protein n=1 Tax=Protea cynaroides TaxID=273540 RepID=A0A9Q0GU13_9MAGN|nr:hypothetical protein NE237_029883 [Protea cynaroides]
MKSPMELVLELHSYDGRQAKTGMQSTNLQNVRRQAKADRSDSSNSRKLASYYQKKPTRGSDSCNQAGKARMVGVFGITDFSKKTALSEEKYGLVSRVFILCDEEDDIQDFLNWIISKKPPDEVKKIPGSDHMVMISKPLALCAYL